MPSSRRRKDLRREFRLSSSGLVTESADQRLISRDNRDRPPSIDADELHAAAGKAH